MGDVDLECQSIAEEIWDAIPPELWGDELSDYIVTEARACCQGDDDRFDAILDYVRIFLDSRGRQKQRRLS